MDRDWKTPETLVENSGVHAVRVFFVDRPYWRPRLSDVCRHCGQQVKRLRRHMDLHKAAKVFVPCTEACEFPVDFRHWSTHTQLPWHRLNVEEARRFALSQPPPMTTRVHLRALRAGRPSPTAQDYNDEAFADGAGAVPATAAAAPATAAAAPTTPDIEVRSPSALGEAGGDSDAELYELLRGLDSPRSSADQSRKEPESDGRQSSRCALLQ